MPTRYRNISPLLLLAGALWFAPTAPAADDTAAFLEALRDRGLYDVALDYLDSAETDRLVSDEFKQRIRYERGATMLAKWRTVRSSTERDELAEAIEQELQAFAEANPDSPLTAEAQRQLGILLVESATGTLARAEQRPGTVDAAALRDTREQLAKARTQMEQVESAIMDRLDEFPKTLDPRTQSDMIDERDKLRATLSQVRGLRSLALFHQAATHEPDSAEFKQINQQAAEEFQALYDKYTTYLVGLNARVYQGECYLNLGNFKQASGCFEDIIVQGGENPVVRPLVVKALALQAECMLAEEDYDAILAKQGEWLDQVRPQEQTDSEWLMLKYQVAEAQRLQAAEADLEETERRNLLAEARDQYEEVARRPGKFQMSARERLAGQAGGAADQAERREVESFAEALSAAKDAISQMNVARQTLPAARENNPEGAGALEQQIVQAEADAMHYLQAAQQLVDDDTPVEELNESRWLMSWLLWQDEQYHRSAVLASFLARRYPSDPSASRAAKVALASYEKLLQQAVAGGGDTAGQAEVERLKDLASFITRRWGATELGGTAFGVLLSLSIRDQQFDAALELVEQMGPDRQPVYRARIGNAMWEAQMRAAGRDDTTVDRAALRSGAVRLLEESFPALAEDRSAGDTLAAASLYLVQARIDQQAHDEAIALLEDPEVGPLALARGDNRVASRPEYAIEAHKAALRAYVTVVPPRTEQAADVMSQLEELVAQRGGGNQLTNVYLSLGVQLQQQIEDLQAAAKVDEAKRVSEAFVTFLDKVDQQGSSDLRVRQWIAQTYFQLAESLEGDRTAEDLRASYYEKASQAFRLLLEEGAGGADPNRTLALKLQYAQTLRHAGQFSEALEMLQGMLEEKEALIDVQTAAAYTLQDWGAAEDATRLSEAISGTGPLNDKGKHIVWGWNYLSKVAASVARSRPEMKDRYRDLFYECWLNIARVNYLRATKATGSEKTDHLNKARSIVQSMIDMYPDFLDTPRRRDFEELMKSIQLAKGERPVGLAELLDPAG